MIINVKQVQEKIGSCARYREISRPFAREARFEITLKLRGR
jgi:hypothetical protein